jgi:hypothetical protein
LFAYVEMSQWNPLYNYYILTKTFKNVIHTHTYTNGILLKLLKEGNTAIWDNMEEFGWHTPQCNKRHKER